MPAHSLGGDGAGDPISPGGGFRLLLLCVLPRSMHLPSMLPAASLFMYVSCAREARHALPEYLVLMGVDRPEGKDSGFHTGAQ